MRKTLTVIVVSGMMVILSVPVMAQQDTTPRAQVSSDDQAPGARAFDWSQAFPLSKTETEMRITVPALPNGKIEIRRSTEHHFNLMKRLSEVEQTLYAYYDGKYQGKCQVPMIQLRNNVMREMGRLLTLMEGYALHFDEDISPYMKLLGETVNRYQG